MNDSAANNALPQATAPERPSGDLTAACDSTANWLSRIALVQPLWALIAFMAAALLFLLSGPPNAPLRIGGVLELLLAFGAIREFIVLRAAARHLRAYSASGSGPDLIAFLVSQRLHYQLRFAYNLGAVILVTTWVLGASFLLNR